MNDPIINNNELEVIYGIVRSHWGFDFKGSSRKTRYVLARASFYYLALDYTKNTLEAIGNFVEKDHATVINARKNKPVYEAYYKHSTFLFSRYPSFKDLLNSASEEVARKIKPNTIDLFTSNWKKIQELITVNNELYQEIDGCLSHESLKV